MIDKKTPVLQPLPQLHCERHERPRPSHAGVYDVVVLASDYDILHDFTESLQSSLAAAQAELAAEREMVPAKYRQAMEERLSAAQQEAAKWKQLSEQRAAGYDAVRCACVFDSAKMDDPTRECDYHKELHERAAEGYEKLIEAFFGLGAGSYEEFALKELACWQLVDEVKALRRGIGLTHVGPDPLILLLDEWRGLPDREIVTKSLAMVRDSREREIALAKKEGKK
jgi:hypothetical protein